MYVNMIISKCESFNCLAFIWKSRFGFGKGHMNGAAHDDSIFSELLPSYAVTVIVGSHLHNLKPTSMVTRFFLTSLKPELIGH